MTGKYRAEIGHAAEVHVFAIYRMRLAQRGPDGSDGAETLLHSLILLIESLAEYFDHGPVPVELLEVRTNALVASVASALSRHLRAWR